tara:strand:+ start:2224 stop:3120 length:897 start_codon:yes stop_codon:yes gene_type:complete
MKRTSFLSAALLLACATTAIFSTSAEADSIRSTLSNWAEKAKDKAIDYAESRKNNKSEPVDVKARDNGDGTVSLDYGFYNVNYSCSHRGFNYLSYTTVPDQGKIKRYKPFHKEDALSKFPNCPSQKKTSSYRKGKNQPQYHRGHGNHQNIWDHDINMMMATNMMTNVVPHNGVQNTAGLWRELEERVECARDRTDVTVYLGNDWGNDGSNDYFKASHGVTTPDRIWRVHVYKSHPNKAFAWLIPNDEVAKRNDDFAYRVSLKELKNALSDDYAWPIPLTWKDASSEKDPYYKKTCSLM